MTVPTVRPAFTVDLNHKIIVGKVTIGKYDGSHPCLTAVTTSDKILIHSPHRRSALPTGRITWSQSNNEVGVLTMSQSITAILAAKIIPDDDRDVLIIGSPTHVLVYHVHDNRDVFYAECTGVTALAVGCLGTEHVVLFVGGGNTVRGYDCQGREVFWTVVSDTVVAMLVLDYDDDGENELLVSCQDDSIKVIKNDRRVVAELQETGQVTVLAPLSNTARFAYSVDNGTIGVYEKGIRLWRVKSKTDAVSLLIYDLVGRIEQLVSVWRSGKWDVRDILTGEVLYKEKLNHPAAAAARADYRGVGKQDLVIVDVQGEVRGYSSISGAGIGINLEDKSADNADSQTIDALIRRKQELLLELRHYETNRKYNNNEIPESTEVGVIPANTRVHISLSAKHDYDDPYVELSVSTNNNTIVKVVQVFGEGLFSGGGETLVAHPKKPEARLTVELRPIRDVPVDVHIKALVAAKSNVMQFHVFELTKLLPRFSFYAVEWPPLPNTVPKKLPDGHVELKINERLQRICMWVNHAFLIATDVNPDLAVNSANGPDFVLNMISLRDKSLIQITIDISGKCKIYTENMQLAGDFIHSMASFLNMEQLQTKASFPKTEERLKELMVKLLKIEDVKVRLAANVAEKLALIRNLVMKAEDSRINNLSEMAGCYEELKSVNEELFASYNIRVTNYENGSETMKQINSIIQQTARLRVGKYSSLAIGYCKTAIKNNNMESLIKIMRTGEA